MLSHPSLQDPNFSKSIVFLSNHSEEDGTLGVILNRPLGKKLYQLDEQFNHFSFGQAQVYKGGPVEADKLIIAAWDWKAIPIPRLYFGTITKVDPWIKQNSYCLFFRAFWLVSVHPENELVENWLYQSHLDLFQWNSKVECWKVQFLWRWNLVCKCTG